MSSVVGSIVEKKVAMEHEVNGDLGNGWLKTNSAGSGAFVLKSWKANESVVMDAFPGYRDGAPTIKRIVVRHVPEPATQRLLIEKGDVDIAENLTPDQVAGLAGDKDVAVTTAPQATLIYVGLNLKTPPFQNLKVRQALHYLVDYDGMANSFLKGQFSVHETFWPSGFWASLDKNEYAFDPAKAKALLAEGGYPNGFEVTLDTPNSSPYLTIAQSIQATMAQAGVKVTLVPEEQKALLTKYRARGHQMLLVYWGPDYMDPHTNADSFARNPDNSDNAKSKPLAWRNAWDIPEITKMADAAVRERDAGQARGDVQGAASQGDGRGPVHRHVPGNQAARRARQREKLCIRADGGRGVLSTRDKIGLHFQSARRPSGAGWRKTGFTPRKSRGLESPARQRDEGNPNSSEGNPSRGGTDSKSGGTKSKLKFLLSFAEF